MYFFDGSVILFFSHNHGSGKWLCLKGNYYWRDPFLTSMIMGGSVNNLPVGFETNAYNMVPFYVIYRG